jgi:hypothetical protein
MRTIPAVIENNKRTFKHITVCTLYYKLRAKNTLIRILASMGHYFLIKYPNAVTEYEQSSAGGLICLFI